jgi:hypothetical protein
MTCVRKLDIPINAPHIRQERLLHRVGVLPRRKVTALDPASEAGQYSHRQRRSVDRSTQFDVRPTFRCFPTPAAWAVVCLAVLVAILGTLTLGGCRASRSSQSIETIDDLFENRLAYRDSLITLTGSFMGWQGGQCDFPSYAAPQESRSDWIFKVGDQCLYVTGGRPSGLSPAEEQAVGARIRLDARLKFASDGRLLLQYVRSTPVTQ